MITRFVIPACALALALVTGGAQARAQVSLIAGASTMHGTLQTPYASRECSGPSESRASGVMLHAGAGVRDFSLTAGYITAAGSGGRDFCIAPELPDGTHRVRQFRATHSAVYGWTFHLRYAPSSLPVMVYGGTGFRFGGGKLGHNQFVSYGAALRTRGSLGLFAAGEITQIHTHFVLVDQVYREGSVISNTEVDRGRSWRKMQMLRFGLEYNWAVFK